MNRFKQLSLCLAAITLLTGCGDSNNSTLRNTNQTNGVDDVLEQRIAEADQETVSNTADSASTSEINTADSTSVPEINSTDQANASEVNTSDSSDVWSSIEASAGISSEDRQSGVDANAPVPETDESLATALSSTEGIDIDLTSLSSTMVYSEVYYMMVKPEDYVGKTIKMSGLYSAFYDSNYDKYYFACIVQDATACCSQGIEFELTDDYTYPDDYPMDSDLITVVGEFDTYEEDGFSYCTLRNAKLLN